jgi:hypothetical protein
VNTNSTVRRTAGGAGWWRKELVAARAQSELADLSIDTEPVRRAAYWLAVVLGNCRLADLELAEDDGTLSVPVATAAGRRLGVLLSHWSEDARRLKERIAAAGSESEVNDCCFDLLEARMEAWAAFVAIDEAYQASLAERTNQDETLSTLIDLLLDRTEELDREMRQQLDLLSLVARFPLLDNWKRSLGPTYTEVLPWWLDGSWQETAEQLKTDAQFWLPGRLDPSRPTATPNVPPGPRASTWQFELVVGLGQTR